MACYHPIDAWQNWDGSIRFNDLQSDFKRRLQIPCGQCIGCRLERSRQWAMRCLHEASCHENNCFITLTYAPEHLPADLSLHYRDFQLFLKRLRKAITPARVRFFMCGEYGENFGRPHFHACLFGFDVPDRVLYKSTKSGFNIYTSHFLSDLWPFGFVSVGDVSFESAAYVARYIMKKVTGDLADDHYKVVLPASGEIVDRTPEFCHMSLKPGIGAPWLEKWASDVYPHDYVIVNGRKVKPPKYYDRKFEVDNPIEMDVIKMHRELDARPHFGNNSDERLAVRKRVASARLSLNSRDLDKEY